MSEENTKKKGMTLKSVPGSLKKIRKVVDDVQARDSKPSPAEKFDLEMARMYINYLKEVVDGMLEDMEE